MPKRTDIHKILIIGSGPIVIGQACEFDYSGTQACKALRKLGYSIVLVNSNPATIMTDPEIADATASLAALSRLGQDTTLPGPVGEENRYSLEPRGTVFCLAATRNGLFLQIAACLGTGNLACVAAMPNLDGLPPDMRMRVVTGEEAACDAVLVEEGHPALGALLRRVATGEGPVRPVLVLGDHRRHGMDMLLRERSLSINIAAAGGNAALMSL